MKRLLTALSAFLLADVAQADTFDTYRELTSGWVNKYWQMGVRGTSSGATTCFIRASYEGGFKMEFVAFAGEKYQSVLAWYMRKPGWKTTKDRDYTALVRFDKKHSGRITVEGTSNNGLLVVIGKDSKFISRMRQSKKFQIKVNGKNLGLFPLRGSYTALDQLKTCHLTLNEGSIAGVSDGDTF